MRFETFVFEQRLFHRVLDGFDIDNALVARADFFFHTVYHALHRAIVFPCGSGGERYRANDEFAVVVHDVAISLLTCMVFSLDSLVMQKSRAQKHSIWCRCNAFHTIYGLYHDQFAKVNGTAEQVFANGYDCGGEATS